MGLERIDLLKKEKGWTNEQLASFSGVPKGTIDKITAGATKDPKLETIKAIARALGCSISEFDDNIGIKNSPALAEASTGVNEIDAQRLYEMLLEQGFIEANQDLSDEDLRFLLSTAEIIRAWFAKGEK